MTIGAEANPSFLVVEDNPQDLGIVTQTLKQYFPHSKVSTAQRLSEAVQLAQSECFDLILLDLNLPDSRGLDTFTQFKIANLNESPIFIFSVFGNESVAAEAVAAGAADFYPKDYLTDSVLMGRAIKNTLERQSILQSLRNSEQKLRGILDSSPDGIVVTDFKGTILFLNTAATLLLKSLSLKVGSVFPTLPNPNDKKQITLKEETDSIDPKIISVVSAYSYWDNTPAYCLTLHDFSHRQKMIDELILAQRVADKSNQTKTTFLANISHEIRTPLNGIMGAITLLSDTPLSREQKDYVNTINHSSDFLLALINDLLDLSKIEVGKTHLETTSFNLNELIQCVLDQFAERPNKKSVTFKLIMDPNLSAWVVGDPWRIRQILTNLLSNAFKFTQAGNVTLSVSPYADSHDPKECYPIAFEVKDTGPGMSPCFLPSLFTPFSQENLDISKTERGSGLGLAISKRLADLMGGSLNAITKIGLGSTFTLKIPLKPSVEPNPNNFYSKANKAPLLSKLAGPSLPNPGVVGKGKRPPMVLVAEDHPINQKLVVTMLEKIGCRILLAQTGIEALSQAAHTAVDLVLMDCQMPEMDGLEATRKLRELSQYKTTPIIAMTAFVFSEDIQHCLDAGMTEVLKKPFKKTELEELLHRWLPTHFKSDSISTLPTLDDEMVKQWKEVIGHEDLSFQKEFIHLFFSTSQDFLSEAASAIQEKDKKTVQHLLHRFKGSTGHIGALRLTALLEETELSLLKDSDLPEGFIPRVQFELEELKTALN